MPKNTKLNENELYWTTKDLQSRAWSSAAILNFAKAPDQIEDFWASGWRKRHLWLRTRIQQIESTEEWKIWLQKSEQRKQYSARAVITKRNRLLEYVEGIEVSFLPPKAMISLRELAVEHYNDYWDAKGRGEQKRASVNDEQNFLDRICVNYLRHQASCYDWELSRLRGRTGRSEARWQLLEKICNAIEGAYPDLAEECDRQLEARMYDDDIKYYKLFG